MLFQFLHYLKNEMGLVGFVLLSLWVAFLVIVDMTFGSLDFDREEVVIPPSPPSSSSFTPPPTDLFPPSGNDADLLINPDPPMPDEESRPADPSECLNIEGTVICEG